MLEKPRPAAAWDLVLQDMKWMAADFQQERLWKASAARCQAAAVRVAVEERRIATSLAEQVRQFWGHVNSLYEYEKIRRRTIFNTNRLSRQLNHMTAENKTTTKTLESTTVARKRKADELEEEEEEVRCPATPLPADPINNNSGSSSGCGEGSGAEFGGLPPGPAEGEAVTTTSRPLPSRRPTSWCTAWARASWPS